MFGNSSINISDQSGTAQLRIDADVNDLVGFAQPETCSEIIVGNYFAQQLLPRIRTDFHVLMITNRLEVIYYF
jgi:hypothetical protein